MLKFTVKQSDLSRALGLACGAVEARTTIPILSNVLIRYNDPVSIIIEATDLENAMRVNCPAEVSQPGDICLPAKRLLSYVKQLSGESILFSSTDKFWATLECGGSKARIPGMDKTSWPEIPSVPRESFRVMLPDFQRMVKICQVAVPPGERKFGVQAARVESRPGTLRMVSCDGAALALAEIAFDGRLEPFMISPTGLREILRLEGATLDCAYADNNLFFSTDECTLVSRRVDEKFPAYEKIMNPEQPTTVTVGREAFKSAVQRTLGFADVISTPVDLKVAEGQVSLTGAMLNAGEGVEILDAEIDGPATGCRLNGVYLMQFCNAFASDLIRLRLGDDRTPIKIEPLSEKNQLGMLMPFHK